MFGKSQYNAITTHLVICATIHQYITKCDELSYEPNIFNISTHLLGGK